MEDILLSVYVVLGAGLIVAGIFLLTHRAAKRREAALSNYCAAHGYRLSITKEPTAREIVLESDNWRLSSSMRALQNSAEAGSSDWRRETAFVCMDPNPLRKTFALQLSKGSSDLDALPPWLREQALSAMRLLLGPDMAGLSVVRTAFCEGGRSGVVFEATAHAADDALEQLKPTLLAWRGGLPLYFECSPGQIRLRLPDVAARSAEEADALLQIGLILK